MSDFLNAPKERKSQIARKCIYCAELILVGSVYTYQRGLFEGKWFGSHYHPECFADLCESGDTEFTPYSNERPKLEEVEA